MVPSSHNFRLNAIALYLIATSLTGCSQPRKPDLQIIPCPPPLIDPQLLTPPVHSQIDQLMLSLGLQVVLLPSAATPSKDSQPSRLKSNPN